MAEAGWLWPAGLGLLGLVFGSFIATHALRWPRGWSALTGRSRCDGCGRMLGARELVPIVSWIALRGRCRTCGARIAVTHSIIELLALGVGVIAGAVAPGLGGAAGAIFGWILLALGAIDLACYRLPNALTALLALAGVLAGLVGLPPEMVDRAIGGIAGFATLWLVARVYRQARGRDGLGGGDAKLLGAIGLWLGWRDLAPTLLVASGLGLAIVAVSMLRGRQVSRTDRLPLGPLLAAAAFLLWAAARI